MKKFPAKTSENVSDAGTKRACRFFSEAQKTVILRKATAPRRPGKGNTGRNAKRITALRVGKRGEVTGPGSLRNVFLEYGV